jgi:hypothetical protein
MDMKTQAAGSPLLGGPQSGLTLTVGKALALSFGIAIALAAVFVSVGVLVAQ